MKQEKVIGIINEFLIDELEIDEADITPDALLKEGLGIDSLDFVDIAVIIEKNFNFRIDAEEMKNVRTLNDFYQYVISKIKVD